MPHPKTKRSSRLPQTKRHIVPDSRKRSSRRTKRAIIANLLSSFSSEAYPKELAELLMKYQNSISKELLAGESLSSNSYPKELSARELKNIDLDQLVQEMTDTSYDLICSIFTTTSRQEEDIVIDNGQQVSIASIDNMHHDTDDTVTTASSNLNTRTRSPFWRREGVSLESNEQIGCCVFSHIEERMSSIRSISEIYQLVCNNIVRNSPCIIRSHGQITAIYIDDQKDRSVLLSVISSDIHTHVNIPPSMVDKMRRQNPNFSDKSNAVVVAHSLGNELNNAFKSASFSGCDYFGDDEETPTVKRGHVRKVYRKKFGRYPTYRIRVNGFRWKRVCSSDDEADDENSYQQTYRGSRRQKKAVKRYLNKIRSLMSSCDEGNSDDSGQNAVAICTEFTKKLVKKLPKQDEEVDTTESDASDTRSLTDYYRV